MKSDIYMGILLLVLSVLYWLQADNIQVSVLSGRFGAQELPKMLAVLLAVFSLLMIAQAAIRSLASRTAAADAQEGERGSAIQIGPALGVLLIGIAYTLLLEILGYPIAIALLLGATAYLMGWRRWPVLIAFSAAGAAILWVVFAYILDIPLPAAPWQHVVAHV
jgi:putative tricarboxylic transport membrane protein